MVREQQSESKPNVVARAQVTVQPFGEAGGAGTFRVFTVETSVGLVGITAGHWGVTLSIHEPTDDDLRRIRDAIDAFLEGRERAEARAEVDAIRASTKPTVDEVLEQAGGVF